MLESQNTTYGFLAIARFCKPQREVFSLYRIPPTPPPTAAAGPSATETAPLPQRLGVMEFNPLNCSQNYIFLSFENVPRNRGDARAGLPRAPHQRSLTFLHGISRRGDHAERTRRWNPLLCHSGPSVEAEMPCGGGVLSSTTASSPPLLPNFPPGTAEVLVSPIVETSPAAQGQGYS